METQQMKRQTFPEDQYTLYEVINTFKQKCEIRNVDDHREILIVPYSSVQSVQE